MAKNLLDTTILIGHLRDLPGYRQVMARLAREEDVGISPINRFEVMQGMREHERQATLTLLNSLPLYPLDADVADLGGELVRQWRTRGVTLGGPNALIAATALCHQAVLITNNVKDFPMTDLQVAAPDAQGRLTLVPATARTS